MEAEGLKFCITYPRKDPKLQDFTVVFASTIVAARIVVVMLQCYYSRYSGVHFLDFGRNAPKSFAGFGAPIKQSSNGHADLLNLVRLKDLGPDTLGVILPTQAR